MNTNAATTATTTRTHLPFPQSQRRARAGLSPVKSPVKKILQQQLQDNVNIKPKKDDMNIPRRLIPPTTLQPGQQLQQNQNQPTTKTNTLQVPGSNGAASIKPKTPTKTAAIAVESQKPKTPTLPKYINCYKADKKTNTTINKRYVKQCLLGKGGFAKVYKLQDQDTNSFIAAKVIPKENLKNERAKKKLLNEVCLHRSLKHKYICTFENCFEDKQNVYLIMELCDNKSLMSLMKARIRLTEEETKYYMLQVLSAVEFMHQNKVIHRDLKLGNLFLSKSLEIKIGDFGLAARLKNGNDRRKTICGTPNYIAPEVISAGKDSLGHSFEVDIWSLGVILYTLLIGKPPFETDDVKTTYKKIKANDYCFPADLVVSELAKDLISGILVATPEKRLRIEQIKSHPFFAVGHIPLSLPTSAFNSIPKFPAAGESTLKLSIESVKSAPALVSNYLLPPPTLIPAPTFKPPTSKAIEQDHMELDENQNHANTNQKDLKPVDNKENVPVYEVRVNKKRYRTPTKEDQKKLKPLVERSPANQKIKIESESSSGKTETRAVRVFEIVDEEEDQAQVAQQQLQQPQIPLSSLQQQKDGIANFNLKNNKKPAILVIDDDDNKKPKQTVQSNKVEQQRLQQLKEQKEKEKEREREREEPKNEVELFEVVYRNLAASFATMNIAEQNEEKNSNSKQQNRNGIDNDKNNNNKPVLKRSGTHQRINRAAVPGIGTKAGAIKRTAPEVYVKRYEDFSSRYGLAYQLQDGGVGAYFNDDTKIFWPNPWNATDFVYIEKKAEKGSKRIKEVKEWHKVDQFPVELTKKTKLLVYFSKRFGDQEGKSEQELCLSTEEIDDEESGAVVSGTTTTTTTTTTITSSSCAAAKTKEGAVFVSRWINKEKTAIVFHLSNQVVQVNFQRDGTKLFLVEEANVVTFVDKEGKSETFELQELIRDPVPVILERLRYTRDLLNTLLREKETC